MKVDERDQTKDFIYTASAGEDGSTGEPLADKIGLVRYDLVFKKNCCNFV